MRKGGALVSTQAESEVKVGYLLSDDLLFTSRITGTASALGLRVKAARSLDALNALIAQEPPRCILIDLSLAGQSISELARSWQEAASPPPRIVGYGSHVDAAMLRAAREAGCDPVLPRSKFVEELPRALAEWM